VGIPPIVIPRLPARPLPPFVASAPQDALTVPKDAKLLALLRAVSLPETPAVISAYQAFGNSVQFQTKLLDALVAINTPIDDRLRIHIARLGAEAFVLDILAEAFVLDNLIDDTKIIELGFIDGPDSLRGGGGRGGHPENFLHFAVRRLGEIAELTLAPDLRRQQMDKAIELFKFLQDELGRGNPFAIALEHSTESVLVEYRRLLVDVIETHYQALLDGLFVKPRDTSVFRAGLKHLADHAQATIVIDVTDEPPPTIALYRIDRKVIRDYFTPAAASDFRFSFFSSKPSPIPRQEPEISFHDLLRKRFEQLALLDDLRAGHHAAANAGTLHPGIVLRQQPDLPPAQPAPPNLHDNTSWQAWARNMWVTVLMSKAADVFQLAGLRVLEDICGFISRYFYAFTVHVPYDLAEGSREANYLTRPYPRAITGCLAHDCLVYAIRWIYILGRLFASPSMPRELRNPRISLVEMPSHVGVMIRATLYIGGDVLIAANNQDVTVTNIESNLSNGEAAEKVVEGMYPGVKTPIAIREIKANPINASALWNEIAKLSDKKLQLPYDGGAEPFLNYLIFNAEDAKIAKQLADELGKLWLAMKKKLDAIKEPVVRRDAIAKALAAYRVAIEDKFKDAIKAFDAKVKKKANEIKEDLDANNDRIPKEVPRVETANKLTGWQRAVIRYRKELDKAEKSLDLSNVNPSDFFPDDGFPTEVP
jgi:hypothetical protein